MYHCHLHIHLVGAGCDVFDLLPALPPLERFTHRFTRSRDARSGDLSLADAVFVHPDVSDPAALLEPVTRAVRGDAQVIVLARPGGFSQLAPWLDRLFDLWPLDMPPDEARFRFLRWQRQRQAAADAWLTRQYLEVAINSAPNLVWFKDRDGIYRKVNDSFCAVVDKPRAQVEGEDYRAVWGTGPQAAEACARSDRAVMEGHATRVGEETVLSGAGQRLLTAYRSPLYDLDGSMMGTAGVGIDITQERDFEEALLAKSHTLESIFTTLECGILCHSADGSTILSVNRAALRILGYESQEDMMKAGFQMVAMSVLDEDKPKLRACIQSLKKEGDSVPIEYRVTHRDGTLCHVMGNVKLIRENGELCYQRYLLDCTAQKLQEKENARWHDDLIQALGADYSLVYYIDLDADLTSDSGSPLRVATDRNELEDIFSPDRSYRESIDGYIDQVVYPADREDLRAVLDPDCLRRVLSDSPTAYQNYRICRNGEVSYAQLKMARTGSWDRNHGVVLGLRSVDREIRREMEHRRVLEDALTQANQASKAKSTFLSNMSHDIRTPMNAVLGFTALAIAHADDKEKVREYLEKIMDSGSHMIDLINDVLDMTRIESGKLRITDTPCSIPHVLRELQDIVQPDVQAKQLDLRVEAVELSDRNVLCDKLRLNQVLLNVLGNAVKYTNAGGRIVFSVTQHPGAPEGSARYEFRVQDNGIGMSADFLTRIFEPFERERNTTTSGVQGTGLGMAITKNIVDMMGGTIHVQSAPGVGTTVAVSFTFPVDRDARPASAAQDSQASADGAAQAPADASAHAPQGRILLVEDNALNQEIALAILEDAGFQADLAENGREAVERVVSAPADRYRLILMDIQMPVMNGYQAAQAIRALSDPARAGLPILAMTANAFEEDKQQALQAGMNGHLSKPIDVDTLLAAIRRMMI